MRKISVQESCRKNCDWDFVPVECYLCRENTADGTIVALSREPQLLRRGIDAGRWCQELEAWTPSAFAFQFGVEPPAMGSCEWVRIEL